MCQKVSTTKKRNVFDWAKKRLEGMEKVPKSKDPPKKKALKPEDEFQQCPSCQRKFGDKVIIIYILNYITFYHTSFKSLKVELLKLKMSFNSVLRVSESLEIK